MTEDWEIGALYWNLIAQYESNEANAVAGVKAKYFDFAKTKDLHLFPGTMFEFNTTLPARYCRFLERNLIMKEAVNGQRNCFNVFNSYFLQRTFKIIQQIIDILNSHRIPDQAFRNAEQASLRF
jgi:hypothetical protein